LAIRVGFDLWPQDADPPYPFWLRARRDRPCHRAAEPNDEFAPSKANAHLPLPCEEAIEAE
jgi:hypothetical protein